ncbi:hypothetical protein IM697_06720 [Streptomyces ferrugineus]|uniref:Uncharacterized protein n=1 Tax=Streptomyces ferrugineus TaxID=1413221 RepID=A0A7M2SPA5_9ACTN|nr:hypothetical protein [Streptomyces ferrugineus]QOV38084.1 hypothetical protein IM697_06720 [Streptomyces ferrugineus]
MTSTAASSPATDGGRDHPSLGDLLAASATSLRRSTAVQALVEEEKLLALDNVRAALVAKEDGVMTCRWQSLAARLYTLDLDEGERAFLGFVLSMVGVRQCHLAAIEHLDERRLKIVLQAVVRLAGNDRIAIGARL